MNASLRLDLLLIPVLLASNLAGPLQAQPPSDGERLFALQVRPILQARCFGCHSESADELEGEFDLSSRQQLLRGGSEHGESVVVLGDADSSKLVAMIARADDVAAMPPKDADRLSEDQVWAIRKWIDLGAPWPEPSRVEQIYAEHAEGVTVKTSGGLTDQWTARKYKREDLWAFEPIRKQFSLDLSPSAGNPIDQFIDAPLQAAGIVAAPRADRLTLIRRAAFDLTGLPPTPQQVNEFVRDRQSDRRAFADLVDRLLASPDYGEQAARGWLDVVRYADSSGFANDWERPNAWRYRDYVVRAFNQDKPFDQFVIEQIAGDEITADSAAGDNRSERRIATGFLRMGPWEHTGMSVAKLTRQYFLDDVTDSVGQVFLAQPLQCCRCHDHKFDPIPTRDYYSIQAIFATTQFADVDADWLAEENRDGMEADKKYHLQRQQANERMIDQLDRTQSKNKADRTAEQFGLGRIGAKWRTRFNWELDRYQPIAMSVYSGKTPPPRTQNSRFREPADPLAKGTLEATAILTGGDPFAAAEAVKPAVLSAVPGALEFAIADQVQGRRAALARWLVSSENTLTARVIVNRIWASHFARGIAANPNNFGATGGKPTHPDLLDWLAGYLRDGGWSIKQLHRQIMNSDAYCRSSRHPNPESLAAENPLDSSYAVFRPRRLAAEELRDSMLMVSGELNRAVGGIPIRPDMNREAALQPRMIMGTFAPSYVPNPLPADRNRRSIYIHKIRGHRLPFMETFNQPATEKSCELRDDSNITPQVFAMFNGEEANDRALALAARVIDESDSASAAVDRLFQLLYSRDPQSAERAAALGHWQQMTEIQQTIDPQPRSFPSEVVRQAIDENTGELFQFTESLWAYHDYQADLQPYQVDARTRGLADLALVMLNSNEFIYVY